MAWDDGYYRPAPIGRMHVRWGFPSVHVQGHELITASSTKRRRRWGRSQGAQQTRAALDRILDLELAIMLETYRRRSWKISTPTARKSSSSPPGHQRGQYREIVETAEA